MQFELLYEREREYVYRTIRGIVRTETEVEDLVQDCFTGAYRARHRYRPDAPPGAWLHRIAVNTAISHLRRRRQERPLPLRTEIPVADRGLEQAEVRATLEEAIAGLSPKVRAAVVLQHFEDRSRDEIAVALGIPAGTVSSRVANGMALLRSRVGVDDMTAAMSHAPTVSTPQSLPGPSSVSGAGRATHRARSPQERNAEAVGW